MLASKQSIWEVVEVKAEGENCIFSKTLLGTTIQDSSIRERKNEETTSLI